MKILITHLGNLVENFVASSVIKGLYKKYKNPNIIFAVKDKSINSLFKYNKKVKSVIYEDLRNKNYIFDLLINLYPDLDHEICPDIIIKDIVGFYEKNKYYDILYGNEISRLNLFQIYYKLSGLEWKGEGYDISYYPKNKVSKKVGISVANANLRNYISEKLDLKSSKLWHIPYKRNIFKKMDEINRCKKIITDDFLTYNIAVCLRKYVYFLKTINYNTKLEFFKKGEIFNIPLEFVR